MFQKLFFISLLSSFIFTHSYSQCLDHQKNLLLQLKNELIFNSSLSTQLVQWNQTYECCKWHGVECDGAGHVISLQLDDESISGGIGDSSSLFRLKYLEKLNLANNDFGNKGYEYDTPVHPIPRGIGNLTYLTHLDLSYAGFGGQVPLEISLLRRLVSLDISCSRLLSRYLEKSYIPPSHATPIYYVLPSTRNPCSISGPLARSFGKLHSLSVLRLDHNDLSTANPNVFANLSRLTILSLADCILKGSFPNKIFQIPTLQHLDLSFNEELSGSMPPFPQNGSLKSIRLSLTNFSGLIPSSIGNLKMLSEIDLSNCRFTGTIPSTFANLTQLTHVDLSSNFFTGSFSFTMFERFSSLVNLHLESNSFTGNIPDYLFPLPSLQTLYLQNNKFIGVIEEFPTINVSKIVDLVLSDNRLEGPIPDSFFQLESLETLLLNGNSFSGAFQLDKIQSLANLTIFGLSSSNLSVQVSNDNSNTYGLQLTDLIMPSCNLYDFPHFIKHSDRMGTLDLSNNRIGGEIPSWIWGTQLYHLNLSFNLMTHVQKPYHIPPSLLILDLQSNLLREELHLLFPPNITSNLQYLSLGNNGLSGSIPTSLCTTTKLVGLELSTNKLGGTIPSCLLDGTIGLTMLDLGQNNISGHIPDNFAPSCVMTYFDVNNNTIEGKIPKSIERCKWLELMNVGNKIINDTFPCMLSSSLRVLVLRSNRFHGEVKCHSSSWEELQIIDISRNNFRGSLQSLNFSSWMGMVLGSYAGIIKLRSIDESVSYAQITKVGITMKGQEVQLFKIFTDFTTIDFSCNDFRGEIPMAIGDLSSLRLLNFSHNALNGSIPKSFGKLGELESLDLSRNQLRGHIPTELSRLTFLSVLNLSYNKLDGEIPRGRQLQTFSADSFLGNPGLCGFNLNISCTSILMTMKVVKKKKRRRRGR